MRLTLPSWCLRLTLSAILTTPVLGAQTIALHVDLTDAPRNIYHARLRIAVHAGEADLVFPKWIPGNHRPSGPIAAVTGIHMEAAGRPLAWQRDPVDMYEFHVPVPSGVDQLDVSLDAITSQDSAGGGGPAASSDFVFANRKRKPRWQESILQRQIKPAAVRAGVGKIGRHTFRHSYSSLLRRVGADSKVQQELLRHSTIQSTMNICTQAMPEGKRAANSVVVRSVLPFEPCWGMGPSLNGSQ